MRGEGAVSAGLRQHVDLSEAHSSVEWGVLAPVAILSSIRHYGETEVLFSFLKQVTICLKDRGYSCASTQNLAGTL